MIVIDLFKKTFLYKRFYYPFRVKQIEKNKSAKINDFSNNGPLMLNKFVDVLDSNKITYWFEFGSLLGAYRDNGFIKNDNDIDVGAFLCDAHKIYRCLTKNGFSLVREFHVRGENGLEQTYALGDTTIDVFYFFERDGYYISNGFYNRQSKLKKGYFDICVSEFKYEKFDVVKIDFLGIKVGAPSNTERHIIEVYGEGYKVYDPNFTDGYNKTKYPLSEKVGVGFFVK